MTDHTDFTEMNSQSAKSYNVGSESQPIRTLSEAESEIRAWNDIPSPSRRVNVFKEIGHDIIRGCKQVVELIQRRFNSLRK